MLQKEQLRSPGKIRKEESEEVSRFSPEFVTKHRCGLQTFGGVSIFSINS